MHVAQIKLKNMRLTVTVDNDNIKYNQSYSTYLSLKMGGKKSTTSSRSLFIPSRLIPTSACFLTITRTKPCQVPFSSL
jgi:hypothetical protein